MSDNAVYQGLFRWGHIFVLEFCRVVNAGLKLN
jgi:hypothetical protein